jgi:hypothetical protein
MTEYIVICQSAWMNSEGWGIGYDWDRERFKTLAKAIKHGWKLRGSDDFNTAEVVGDKLVSFGWMGEKMDEDDATMAEIAEAIGLSYGQGE